jgi:hypothetical protein
MAWVYILRGSYGRYYIGSTENLDRRLAEHRRGKVHSPVASASHWTSPSYLLMAYDTMRDIRLFQVCDFFLDKFNGQSANGIFQMCDLRCSDDRRRNRLLLEHQASAI